ncbi:reverse transcriptase [Kosakonia radicincitans DSM 16656]|nr:reverse transcriptase [Kosakonia radicincitans DSM 16656]
MDDIILSSKDLVILNDNFKTLCEALQKSRYEVNEVKTSPPAKVVTVFNLNLSHNNLRVTSKRLVEFLQAYAQSKNKHERKGIAAYIRSVNPDQANRHFPKK